MHIDVHEHAADDLRQLRQTTPKAVAAIMATLQQMEVDPRLVDKLTTHGNNEFGDIRVNVKRWQQTKGVTNVWRFRVLDTPATVYRVVYGYHYQTKQLCVLAVVPKEAFDYELDSEIGKRILADWNSL